MVMDASAKQALLKGLAGGQRQSELARQFGISRERVRQYKVEHLKHLQPRWERSRRRNLRLLQPFIELVGPTRRCRMCGRELTVPARASAYCLPCRGRRDAIRFVVSRLRTYQSSHSRVAAQRAFTLAAYLVRKHGLTLRDVEQYLGGEI